MGQRGRKKGANGEQSRALLLTIAAEEFAANGYYQTKVSNIVKRANVTQPTFYLYFQSKEDIFQELVQLFHDKLAKFIQDSRLEPGVEINSVPEQITTGLTKIFSFFAENPDLTRIGFIISSKAEVLKEEVVAYIEENLTFEAEAGYFRMDIDMNMVAESLVGIIQRLTFTKLFPGLKSQAQLAKEIVQLLFYGMIREKGDLTGE
ncbi:TetR/AcrR family transcriptional regulator [Virgibacillus sp. FSP13]